MDLSKAFDTINHKLLVAKLRAYIFDIASYELLLDYLATVGRELRLTHPSACGMAQGSVLGPMFFNIQINDMFFLFVDTWDTLSHCPGGVQKPRQVHPGRPARGTFIGVHPSRLELEIVTGV